VSLEFLNLCLWSNNVCMLFFVMLLETICCCCWKQLVVVVVGYVDYVVFMMLKLVTGLLCMCLGL
jgi:hypothetical protein